MRSSACLLTFLLICPVPVYATDSTECSALRGEVEALKAKVLALESAAQTTPTATQPLRVNAQLPGTATKPVARQTLVIEEPYSRTGCSTGLFKSIEPAKWQDPDLWLDLEKGLSPAVVEALLGAEHYDESGGDNIVWHYGKCGASSRAQVLFSSGKLADWRAPSR